MATKDEILGTNPQGGKAPDPIVKKEDRISAVPAPSTPLTPEVKQEVKTEDPQQSLSFVDMVNKLSPYTPPTEEELEKERKKEKREKIFSALGDGISALSNLYFTTQGAPNMHSGKSMSAAATARWDKLKSDRKANELAYFKLNMQAQQADDAKSNANRSWKHMLEREGVEDKRHNETQEYRKERDAITDQNALNTAETQKDQFDRTLAERERSSKVAEGQAQQRIYQTNRQNEDANTLKREIAANEAKAKAGEKQTKFALGEGKELAIDNNVWAGSWQQVYDAMLPDLLKINNQYTPNTLKDMSLAEREAIVKQHWQKSSGGKRKMYELAREEAPEDEESTTTRPMWDPNK